MEKGDTGVPGAANNTGDDARLPHTQRHARLTRASMMSLSA
jgi:hypothetical protein